MLIIVIRTRATHYFPYFLKASRNTITVPDTVSIRNTFSIHKYLRSVQLLFPFEYSPWRLVRRLLGLSSRIINARWSGAEEEKPMDRMRPSSRDEPDRPKRVSSRENRLVPTVRLVCKYPLAQRHTEFLGCVRSKGLGPIFQCPFGTVASYHATRANTPGESRGVRSMTGTPASRTKRLKSGQQISFSSFRRRILWVVFIRTA